MKTIHVAKAFTLNHEGQETHFAKGRHEVTDDVADHWFVKGHCDEGAIDTDPNARYSELASQHAQLTERFEYLARSVFDLRNAADKVPGLRRDLEASQTACALATSERDAAVTRISELEALVSAYELQAGAEKKPAKK